MSSPFGRGVKTLLVVAALAGVAVGTWLIFGKRDNRPQAAGGFVDAAAQAGITFKMSFLPNEQGETFKINLYDHGCGLAVGDYDGDGWDDIYFLNQLGANALYRNQGDGTFRDVTSEAGIALADRVCVGATFVDYDNDGHLDLFVTSTRGGNVLFRNTGKGRFEDVTQAAGVSHVGHSQNALFFDYDGDGWLDLYLTNTASWTTDTFDTEQRYYVGKGEDFARVIHSPKEFNILYRNDGTGHFVDVTEETGLKGRGWAGDAVAFDYNEDGRPDLLVTSMFGRAQLYRNNPDGKFEDVTLEVLGQTPWGGLGARVLDYNNDGKLDVFIVDMHSDMWMGLDAEHESLPLARKHEKTKFRFYNGPYVETKQLIQEEFLLARLIGFKHAEVLFGNAFYRNKGDGKFAEVSEKANLETFWPWGIAVGDFDNDGFEDLFIPTGMGYPFYYWPNQLMMNQGDGTFVNQADAHGVEPPPGGIELPEKIAGKPAVRSSRCAAVADFDGDGRLELVVNNFNHEPYYFVNRFEKKSYLALKLRGARSNRDAIGAVVRVAVGGQTLTRLVHGAAGYLSQSSATLHFGLGEHPAVDHVEITWPNGRVQRLEGLAINTKHEIVEPDGI
jgi:enediyne biosynthesis protein E4